MQPLDEEFGHIVSWIRQAYAPNLTDIEVLPSFNLSYKKRKYTILVTCDDLVCFTCNASGHKVSNCAVMAQPKDVRSGIVAPKNNLQEVEVASAQKSHAALVNDTPNTVLSRDNTEPTVNPRYSVVSYQYLSLQKIGTYPLWCRHQVAYDYICDLLRSKIEYSTAAACTYAKDSLSQSSEAINNIDLRFCSGIFRTTPTASSLNDLNEIP